MNTQNKKHHSKSYSRTRHSAKTKLVVLLMVVAVMVLLIVFSIKLVGCSDKKPAAIAQEKIDVLVINSSDPVPEPKKMFEEVTTIPSIVTEANYVDCPSIRLPETAITGPVSKANQEVIYLTRDYMESIEFGERFVLAADTQLECTRNNTKSINNATGSLDYGCKSFLIKEYNPGKAVSQLAYKNVMVFVLRPYEELKEQDLLSGNYANKIRVKVVNAKCEDMKK